MACLHAAHELFQKVEALFPHIGGILRVRGLFAEALVEHVAHGVHANAVDAQAGEVIGGGVEKAPHVGLGKVEGHGVPNAVFRKIGGIGFVGRRSVEVPEPLFVFTEVGAGPIQDHADALLVGVANKVGEILRAAVAARGGEKTRGLIAPAAVVWVFHNGQKLHVGKIHFLHVVDKLVGQFPVV